MASKEVEDLARSLKSGGLASNMEDAIKKAEQMLGKKNKGQPIKKTESKEDKPEQKKIEETKEEPEEEFKKETREVQSILGEIAATNEVFVNKEAEEHLQTKKKQVTEQDEKEMMKYLSEDNEE